MERRDKRSVAGQHVGSKQKEYVMSPDWIIGALALVTIGSVAGLAIFHFGFFLKDPRNLDAFKRIAEDRTSATTAMSSEGVEQRSLRQRLDQAPSLDAKLSSRGDDALGLADVVFDTAWRDWRQALGTPKD